MLGLNGSHLRVAIANKDVFGPFLLSFSGTRPMNATPAPRLWWPTSWRYVRTPVVVYLAVAMIVATFQRSFLYHPHKATAEQMAPPNEYVSSLTAKTEDGLTLNGWHFRALGAKKYRPLAEASRVVLYFPGNAENRACRADECHLLAKLGCDVVLVDYRGFGENEGSPTETGFSLDAEAVWREVVENQKVSPDKIVLYGESLGGAISTQLAETRCKAGTPPEGLILRSTFASMTETAGHHMWYMPVSLLLVDRFPSDQRIPSVTCPLLQFHGDVDQIVPVNMARRLHAAAPVKSANGIDKKLVIISGADHNDAVDVAGPNYPAAIKAFFEKLPRVDR